MESLGKILLRGLPKGLEIALLQQLDAEVSARPAVGSDGHGTTSAAGSGGHIYDLVIQPGDGGFDHPLGTPVLSIDLTRRQRLGLLLRTARQMIEEPSLHLEDFRIGPWLFRPQEKTLEQQDQPPVTLTDKEVDILSYLAKCSAGGVTVGREELLRRVWGYSEGVDTHTLETHIYRLRQKIEEKNGDAAPAAAGSPQSQNLLVTLEDGYRLNL
ncbi:MAG: winged helix-turn-helix domain-containing protein [Alphaproteobacteria bacterium]